MTIEDDDVIVSLSATDDEAWELSPNELLEDNLATFVVSRVGYCENDLTVYLQFSGTADREDYQLEANGAVMDESVVIPAGYSYVEVTLTALHDDMTAGPDGDPEIALLEIASAPDGSYQLGETTGQEFSIYDTSTWRDVATNHQLKAFPEYTQSHPAPPASGTPVLFTRGWALRFSRRQRELGDATFAEDTIPPFPQPARAAVGGEVRIGRFSFTDDPREEGMSRRW